MDVQIVDIQLVGDNPTRWADNFQFQIDFECGFDLKDDLEWKITYVGSADTEKADQVLTSVLVGPIPRGHNRFVLEAPPPDTSKIPDADAVGITALLLTCSYINQEFVRVGYYVNNEYAEQTFRDNPPRVPQYDKLTRNIMMQKPRVTRFQIVWDANPNEPMPAFPTEAMLYSEMSNSMPDVVDIMEDDDLEEPIVKRGSGPDFTEKLTPELSKLVFQNLLVEDLARCRRVSKRWKELIDSGVNWSGIYLPAEEWDDEAYGRLQLEFVLGQSSSSLSSLEISNSPITADLLVKWLSKCGSSLKKLDLSWCNKLEEDIIAQIMQYCTSLEELYLMYFGTASSIDNSLLRKVLARYQDTLVGFGVHGFDNESLAIVLETAPNLKILYTPSSEITDDGILNFVSRASKIEVLGLEFSEISLNTMKSLRSKVKVKSSIVPEDFTIALAAISENSVEVSIYVKDWPNTLTEDEFESCKILPPGLKYDQEAVTFEGTIDEANKIFLDAGFKDINVKSNEEESEEEEEEVCEICQSSDEFQSMLLECDECRSSYHLECLKMAEMPKDSWICENCSSERNIKKRKM